MQTFRLIRSWKEKKLQRAAIYPRTTVKHIVIYYDINSDFARYGKTNKLFRYLVESRSLTSDENY